jgi:hypothetical protein
MSQLGVMNSPGMNDAKRRREEKKVISEAKRFARSLQKKHEFKASFGNMLWFAAFKETSSIHTDNYPKKYTD